MCPWYKFASITHLPIAIPYLTTPLTSRTCPTCLASRPQPYPNVQPCPSSPLSFLYTFHLAHCLRGCSLTADKVLHSHLTMFFWYCCPSVSIIWKTCLLQRLVTCCCTALNLMLKAMSLVACHTTGCCVGCVLFEPLRCQSHDIATLCDRYKHVERPIHIQQQELVLKARSWHFVLRTCVSHHSMLSYIRGIYK